MTLADAQTIAKRELERIFHGSEIDPVIVDDATDEKDFGWVFYYESRQYLETRNTSYHIAGNEPLVVDRRGRLHRLPTSAPPHVGIQRLRDAGVFDQP